jgi:hypothetical protein
MKKHFSILLSLLLLLGAVSCGSRAFAADIQPGGTAQADVNVVYKDGTASPDVYSADITWGQMEFTYTKSGTYNWLPESHTYRDTTVAGWTAVGNDVTVTNHSNRTLTVEFTFAKEPLVTDEITGTFDVATKTLNAGVLGDYAGADKLTSHLTLNGALSADKTAFTKIGVLTVTLDK